MSPLNVAFEIPPKIAAGLATGVYERVGGIIRETTGKKTIVTWLREAPVTGKPDMSNIFSLSSLNATSNAMNLAVSTIGAASSVLNLAVSTMGFIVVLQRLNVIEQQLEQAQKALQTIDYKIDLSFYANFRAALDLALNAFTMSNSETRKMSAMQAINRFLEAEHHYTKLADIEIGNGSPVADEFLLTLCLAYITEVRCYLELEEIDTARRRLHAGITTLQPRFQKHVNTLLTSNPAAYLHPRLKGQVGLKQLTKVYQWLEPGLSESDVFEKQRENLFKLAQNPEEWTHSLPQAIRLTKVDTASSKNTFNTISKQAKKFIGNLPSISEMRAGSQQAATSTVETEAYDRLPAMMEIIETMVEDCNRLGMYESEVETIHKLGMSFQEWQQLAPSSSQGSGGGLMYITVSDN